MTNEERRKAAEWFGNRAKNCQMPGARRMYEIATEALEMAIRALEGDGDMISRQAVMKEFSDFVRKSNNSDFAQTPTWNDAVSLVGSMPSAQPERDIPVKPIETTDKAWGIPKRQAVCPKCDYYLGHVAFLGDYKGKRVTYCETCGQAIDWEEWNFDE